MAKGKTAIIFTVSLFLAGALAADPGLLTLKDYLAQVRAQGPDYQRAVANRKIVELSRELLGKHWSAQLNTSARQNNNEYNYYYDGNGMQPLWQQNYDFNGSINIQDSTAIGLNPGFSYDWDRNTQMADAESPNSQPSWGDWYSAGLNIPLWQNFLGAQVRNQDKSNYLNNDASRDSWDYQIGAAVENAEIAYEVLAYDRAVVERDRDLMGRYQKLMDWANKKSGALDQLQAKAALENLGQSLDRAEDNVQTDQATVNRLRGVWGLDVGPCESLDALAEEAGAAWPGAEPERLDLEALKVSLHAEDANLVYTQEGVKLPVNLFGGIGGNLSSGTPAVANGYYSSNPALSEPNIEETTLQLSLSVPFEFFLPRWTAPLRTVQLQDKQQSIDLDESINSDDQQWADMSRRYKLSEGRIKDAAQLEADQLQKAELGVEALAKGQVRMYEALNFQSAYQSACLNRLQWVQQKLALLAQARLYSVKAGEPEAGMPALP